MFLVLFRLPPSKVICINFSSRHQFFLMPFLLPVTCSYIVATNGEFLEHAACRWAVLMQAMSDVGFTANDIEHVASLLAIICKFGALLFDETAETGGSQLLDPNQLEQLAEVLGVDAYSLLDALTTTTTVVREETFVNAHSVDKVGERIGWDSRGACACGCSAGGWLQRGPTQTACDVP